MHSSSITLFLVGRMSFSTGYRFFDLIFLFRREGKHFWVLTLCISDERIDLLNDCIHIDFILFDCTVLDSMLIDCILRSSIIILERVSFITRSRLFDLILHL